MFSIKSSKYEKLVHQATKGKLTPDEQDRLMCSVIRRVGFIYKLWGVAFLALILACTGLKAHRLLAWLANTSDTIGEAILIFVFLMIVAILSVLRSIREKSFVRSILARQLLQMGVRPNACLSCGYNLKGSVNAACPECGAPIAPCNDTAEQNQ